MSPSTFSSAALPPGKETTQRIHHPPACLTAWTTLNIIYCPYSFCLSLLVYISISHFFSLSFMSFFAHLSHPLCLLLTLPLPSPWLFLYYCCFSDHITPLLCWGLLYGFENEHTVCLCVWFHAGLCPLSELHRLDLSSSQTHWNVHVCAYIIRMSLFKPIRASGKHTV